jgi:hypothetical protein
LTNLGVEYSHVVFHGRHHRAARTIREEAQRIFVGYDEYGRAWVIHNDMGGIVCWVLFEAFAACLPVTLASRKARDHYEQRAVVSRVQSLLLL